MKKIHEVIDDKLYFNGEFKDNKTQILLFNSERKRIFVNGLLVKNPFLPESRDDLYDYIEQSFNGVPRDEIEILPDFSNVYTGFLEDLSGLFYGMTKLKDITGISSWNVYQVSDVTNLFAYCRNLKDITPLSEWRLVNIKKLDSMFYRCMELEDISCLRNVFRDSHVSSLNSFLSACFNLKSLDGLQHIHVENVIDSQYMCENCFRLIDIQALTEWKFNNNINIRRMLSGCESLREISPVFHLFGDREKIVDSELFYGSYSIYETQKQEMIDRYSLMKHDIFDEQNTGA